MYLYLICDDMLFSDITLLGTAYGFCRHTPTLLPVQIRDLEVAWIYSCLPLFLNPVVCFKDK